MRKKKFFTYCPSDHVGLQRLQGNGPVVSMNLLQINLIRWTIMLLFSWATYEEKLTVHAKKLS